MMLIHQSSTDKCNSLALYFVKNDVKHPNATRPLPFFRQIRAATTPPILGVVPEKQSRVHPEPHNIVVHHKDAIPSAEFAHRVLYTTMLRLQRTSLAKDSNPSPPQHPLWIVHDIGIARHARAFRYRSQNRLVLVITAQSSSEPTEATAVHRNTMFASTSLTVTLKRPDHRDSLNLECIAIVSVILVVLGKFLFPIKANRRIQYRRKTWEKTKHSSLSSIHSKHYCHDEWQWCWLSL